MVLKGLRESSKSFVVVVTKSDGKHTFTELKGTWRSFEATENLRSVNDDSVMRLRMSNASVSSPSRLSTDLNCYNYGETISPVNVAVKRILWCNHCQITTHNDQAHRRQRDIRGKGREDRLKRASDTLSTLRSHQEKMVLIGMILYWLIMRLRPI